MLKYTAIAGLLLGGCVSASSNIAKAGERIQDLASSSEQRFINHGDTSGAKEQRQIQDIIQGVQVDLTEVQDSVPYWVSAIQEGLLVILGILVVVILWQSGVGLLLRRVIGWIPSKTSRKADMINSVLDNGKGESTRELVAAMRAEDPLLDQALRKMRNT